MNNLEQFELALLSVDRITSKEIFSQYLNEIDIMKGIYELLAPSLVSIGEKWSKAEISLAQVYMSGRICEELVNMVFQSSSDTILKHPGMAITTLNDFHFLGKRIVYSVLRSYGFTVMDFGRKSIDELIQLIEENDIKILLISVLMLNSALKVKELKDKLSEHNNDVKLIVGGAPFRLDEELWKQVGADASGINASDSIRLVNEFSGGVI